MPVDSIQRGVQPLPPVVQGGGEGPKKSPPKSDQAKSTIAPYESNAALVDFWDTIINLLIKIPFIQRKVQSAWEGSIHLLQPRFKEDQIDLSASSFKAPKYFTDSMKRNVSRTIAENYQYMMQHFSADRLKPPTTPKEQERLCQAFSSLCYSSYRDCLEGDGIEQCHNALYDAIKMWMDMTNEAQVHLGTADDTKKRQTLSSDFLSAFCPQLESSTSITHLHIHGPIAREVDRKKLLDALKKNTSIQTLYFDLSKEDTESILPQLPQLLKANPHLTEIVFQNYSKKRDFVIEDGIWQNLAAQVLHRPITLRFSHTPHMPQYIHHPIQEKVSFEEN